MSKNDQLPVQRFSLPVIDPVRERRSFLLAGAAVVGTAACGPMAGGGDADVDGSTGGPDAMIGSDAMTGAEGGGSDAGAEAGAEAGATTCTALPIALGPLSAFPMGMWKHATGGMPVQKFIVGHDAMGIFVYTSVCTHSGCEVPPPVSGISTCPCHGSTFDDKGAKLGGPAMGPLVHSKAAACDGMLTIDPTMTVPATTRVRP